MRLQAQDEKFLAARRRRPNRRARQVAKAADEITPPRDARRMRPYVFGDS